MTKIAINGFGRIGRPTFRRILDKHPDIEVVAINDLTEPKILAHLLKYDSNYGIYDRPVDFTKDSLIADNKEIKVLAQKEPQNLPWKEMKIDIVLECTGKFSDREGAKKHLEAGAKKVIISAPSESEEVPTYILGANEEKYDSEKDSIISMGSCTTNCLAPVVRVLHENLGIEKALMTTVHAITTDQRLLDLPHHDPRRARTASLSIIPTTTGAALTVTKVIPELKGKFHGIALRVPVAVVSIADLVAQTEKGTTADEINSIFRKAAQQKNLKGILTVEDAPLVSVDYRGNSYSTIIDAPSTMVIGKNLIKVLVWYDNEWGYACRLAEMTEYLAKRLYL